MRRKRYKQGHLAMLSLEASTLTFKDINKRVAYHTGRSRPEKLTKLRPCDIRYAHRITSFTRITSDTNSDIGLVNGIYNIGLDYRELDQLSLSPREVVKNIKTYANEAISNWASSTSVYKAGHGRRYLNPDQTKDAKALIGDIDYVDNFWIIIQTQIYGVKSKIGSHHSVDSLVYSEEDSAAKYLETYYCPHYVIMMGMFEYPGYFLRGKID